MTSLPFKEIAAAMLRRGIPVIPVKSHDKRPLPEAWQMKASVKPSDILDWIKHYGNDINCGAVATLDGQWMLDADNMELWSLIEQETGRKLPRTFTTCSRKGQHKYWRQSAASRAMGNRSSHAVPYEFDAQVDRKQVIAPGSTHPSGFVYGIVDDCEIVEAPDWLVAWITTKGEKEKAPTPKGCRPVHEDFDFEEVMEYYGISGDWQDGWYVTDVCPIAGHKHQQSTRTGFFYDGTVFGWHDFALSCEGSNMRIGKVIAFLNAKMIENGGEPYRGTIWSEGVGEGDDSFSGIVDLEWTDEEVTRVLDDDTVTDEAPAVIIMPAPSLEMPKDVMYGELGKLAQACKTPLGLTYPALITAHSVKLKSDMMCGVRVNLYCGLIAMPESGKNVSIDRTLEILGLVKGFDYRKASPAGDTQLAILLGDEASGKRGSKERKPGPTRMLLVSNELTDVLRKTGVENSTLASKLCDLWDDSYYEKIIAKDKVTVNCRLSWLGGIPAGVENTARFSQLFGSETNFGLYPRFIFGYTDRAFNYRPWQKPGAEVKTIPIDCGEDYIDCLDTALDPMTNTVASVDSISSEADQMHQDWKPVCEHPGRIKYNALKVAVLTASANRDKAVTADCMVAAIRFMEWQIRLRQTFETGEALNQAAECRDVILKTLKHKGAENAFVAWRRIAHDNKWGVRYNDWMVKTTIDNLVEAGELIYQPTDKGEGKVGVDKTRVILNPIFTGNVEGRKLVGLPPVKSAPVAYTEDQLQAMKGKDEPAARFMSID